MINKIARVGEFVRNKTIDKKPSPSTDISSMIMRADSTAELR